MIIDVTGFGWSGSGAYIDLLREYNNVQFPNNDPEWECYLLHWVDGVKDLEYKLMEKNCRVYDADIAVRRFLKAAKRYSTQRGYEPFEGQFYNMCMNYVDSLEGKKFILKTASDRIYFNNRELLCFCYNKLIDLFFCNNLTKSMFNRRLVDKLQISRIHSKRIIYHPANFYDATHSFISTFFSFLKKNGTMPIVTNHLFSPDCPHLFFNLVGEDVRCIVVRRDPRDTFLLAKKLRAEGISAVPSENVDDFIWFYKKTIQETKINHPKVLCLNFEDLIYNYDRTVAEVESFTGVKEHVTPKKYFNPSISINNTQLFKNISSSHIEIAKIEHELRDSLFDFSQYNNRPDFSTKLF